MVVVTYYFNVSTFLSFLEWVFVEEPPQVGVKLPFVRCQIKLRVNGPQVHTIRKVVDRFL